MATVRRIVQVAIAGVTENAATQCEALIVARCDDGTVWLRGNRGTTRWEQIPDVPQGAAEAEKGGR